MRLFVMETKEHSIDRLAMRTRPHGSPIMQQAWENLLFLHWPMDPAVLRPLIPECLEIDLFEGQAWVSVTPFELNDLRALTLPAIPGLSSFTELNVRTYVVHNGQPGLWFFSLDASKLLPAIAARVFFMLPYFKAQMDYSAGGNAFAFSSKRIVPPDAEFEATWRTGQRLRAPDTDSLAFFLVERYCCYALGGPRLFQIRIYHHPWILVEAEAQVEKSTMFSAAGLPEPGTTPLAHFSEPLEVEIWAPTAIEQISE